ncbi:MAG: DNA polymerase III subunit alpha [Planctomycetota bacterium]
MYVSLHNRSAYSFGSALTLPEQLADFAMTHSMSAMALTDLHGLYAAVLFQQACHQRNIKPIFGVELELAGDASVTLLAQTLRGYGRLCRLVSRHHLGERPLEPEELNPHAAEIVCLIGRTPNAAALERLIALWRETFAERLYVELSLHRREDAPPARQRARRADELGIPVVASCASRCLRREQGGALRALASIGTLTLLDQPHPDKPVGAWHLRTPAAMERLFARRPDALANTYVIAEQCNVTLDLAQNRFPSFASPDGRSAMEHLRELGIAGCRRRYVDEPPLHGLGGKRPTLAEALERLERELAIIEQVHYAEYFLVFHEIVQYCRSQGIATLARGSAADALICYALGVSHACPFRFDLPFDRFINPERAKFSKMADIDLDLPWDRRDQVIRWVYDRWGHDRVAMIGAPHTFRARAAVGELGKVFGLPAHEVHRVTKLLPRTTAGQLGEALAAAPEARGLPIEEEPYRTILRMAGALEGLPRHWSMHPCGLVVAPEPLTDLVPVQRSPKGPLVAQYEMNAIEDLGFIKIDLLGQAGLSVLRDTLTEIERTRHHHVDLCQDVDYSDAATWGMIAGGEARGVHHIESPAMTSLIRQCQVRDIDGLTAIVAIIRPGAANQGKKDVFARRCQGFEPPSYAHPALVPVLEKTYGLMVFEEHILQVAVEFAGMNLGRADVLRRALNREHHALIRELRTEFYACARRCGRTDPEIDAVWAQLESFCGFMFNKAHSAEYAVEAFQGAWLKRRWPAHYLAAILSNYRGFYAHSPTLPQILYVLEALRLGIGFLPPCVNRAQERFSVECGGDIGSVAPPGLGISNGLASQGLRPGLYSIVPPGLTGKQDHTGHAAQLMIRVPVMHIKGLSQRFIERYLAQREKGPFASLTDFIECCRPGEVEAHLLFDSGALDGLGRSRPELFWKLRRQLRLPDTSSSGLWEANPTAGEDTPPVELTRPNLRQIATREMELLGFPISIDPLTYLSSDDHGRRIAWSRYVPVAELDRHLGRRVTICGLMVADRINPTQNGDLMKFVTLADRTGFVETCLFPDIYQRFGHLTAAHPIMAATGVVEPFENRNGFTFRVESISCPTKALTGDNERDPKPMPSPIR